MCLLHCKKKIQKKYKRTGRGGVYGVWLWLGHLTHFWQATQQKSVQCQTKTLFSKFINRIDILWHVGEKSLTFPTKINCEWVFQGGKTFCFEFKMLFFSHSKFFDIFADKHVYITTAQYWVHWKRFIYSPLSNLFQSKFLETSFQVKILLIYFTIFVWSLMTDNKKSSKDIF